MVVEASCNGAECAGEDYEKKICSREEELAEQIRALLDENESLGRNQCTTTEAERKEHTYYMKSIVTPKWKITQ